MGVTLNPAGLTGKLLGSASITANQTGITTEVDLTGLTVTVNLDAGRRIKVEAFTPLIITSNADGTLIGFINAGGSNIARFFQISGTAIGASGYMGAMGFTFESPAAGSRTYKLRGLKSGGTGTMSIEAGAAFPAWIAVYDVGPA